MCIRVLHYFHLFSCCKNKEDYFIPSSLRDHWGLKKSINLWSDIVLNYNGEILSISQAERTRFKRSAKDHIAERFTEPRTKKRKVTKITVYRLFIK